VRRRKFLQHVEVGVAGELRRGSAFDSHGRSPRDPSRTRASSPGH
jgi:hypothetical protein